MHRVYDAVYHRSERRESRCSYRTCTRSAAWQPFTTFICGRRRRHKKSIQTSGFLPPQLLASILPETRQLFLPFPPRIVRSRSADQPIRPPLSCVIRSEVDDQPPEKEKRRNSLQHDFCCHRVAKRASWRLAAVSWSGRRQHLDRSRAVEAMARRRP